MKENRYIVIADSHLGAVQGDVATMIDFLHTLEPGMDELLFLGDLFHIWAGPVKYHNSLVRELLDELRRYQDAGGRIHLVVGNRDAFFPEITERGQTPHLPFDTVATDFAFFNIGEKSLAAVHGDTVNSLDLRYLKWRKLIRSSWFQKFFDLLPARWVKRIMFRLETELKGTNTDFRREFPGEEWDRFVKEVSRCLSPDLLIVGHFHPESIIEHQHESTKALVIPDWHSRQAYLVIAHDLSFQVDQFVKN